MDSKQVENFAADFLGYLYLPIEKSAKLFIVGIIGIPGSGRTTVARKLVSHLPGVVVVQANSARYLLKHANLPWGDNVREVTCAVARKLLSQGYSVIFDGGALEQKDRDNIKKAAAPSNAEVLFIRIHIDPSLAETREIAKYNDPRWVSSFNDFRVNTPEKMAGNIRVRAVVDEKLGSQEIHGLITEIDNSGSLADLDAQVEAAVGNVKNILGSL
ncbi:MAG: hypothetical protein CEN90_616 [Parcubacteria group bacterium Licking1014_17]|nr:MAG: hypothetical protein CEN90_616 [Parcubacteria group bacterium Licking1014_17]